MSKEVTVFPHTKSSQEEEIRLSMKMFSIIKWIRVFLAVLIVLAYFGGQTWVFDVVLASIVLLLVAPMGFFDVFIQKLVEYNASSIEERVVLNAREANKAISDLHKKIDESQVNDG